MQRSRGRRVGLLAVLAASTLFSAGISELILRVAASETDLLHVNDQAFWQARLRAGRSAPTVDAREADTEYDPQLGWRMRRNHRAEGVRHGAKGFRGAEPSRERRDPRALFIGDSFTYGLGVSDELTFAAQFGERSGFEAINAGVSAYGADQALLMWELEGRALAPDLVVLGYVVDDFERNALWLRDAPKPYFEFDAGENAYRLSGVPVPRVVDLPDERLGSSHLRLVDGARALFERMRRKLGIANESALADKARLSEHILERLRDSVSEAGARLLVVVIGRYRSADHDWIEASIAASCARLGIPHIDLAAAMREGDLDSYFGDNGHYSARGHRFAAERIAEALR